MTNEERTAAVEYLRRAHPRIRHEAAKVGSLHSGWNVMGSIEHFTEGKPPYVFEGDKGLQDLVALVQGSYPENAPSYLPPRET